jgi:hypothetical protein
MPGKFGQLLGVRFNDAPRTPWKSSWPGFSASGQVLGAIRCFGDHVQCAERDPDGAAKSER